ncbi:MAG: DASS family sodium-coupled anion symporter [Negativicutes bacterium]|nr:DASS family sodium-coupled anion symporter [Negativicutes bacterium]
MNPANSETRTEAGECGKEGWRTKVGIPLAVIVPLLVLTLANPVGLSVAGHKALALFSGIFILYLTEAIPLAITSIIVVPAAVLMGITTTKGALSGFGSSTVYLMLGAFVLAAAMAKSRLAERITYLIMKLVGESARSIIFGVMAANVVLAFLVPSTVARTAILLPVCLGIIKVFGAEGRSKFAAGLLLILAYTNSTISAGILTATTPNPVTIEFISKAAGGHLISYGEWFIYGFPPSLLMTLFTWWYVSLVYKPEIASIPGGDQFVKSKLAELGPLSKDEKRALVVFAFVVTLWVTGEWTKIDATIACLIGVCMLFIPGLGFMSWSDANKGISWQVLMVTGGGISLGDTLIETGAAKWLAVTIFHTLGMSDLSLVMTLIVIMFIVQYMHLVFVGSTPMATGLIPIVIGMAGVLNVNPLVFAMPAGMIIGGYPLLMFYSCTSNILVYGTGKLVVADFLRTGLVLCTVACFVYVLCALTYWRWLGLF